MLNTSRVFLPSLSIGRQARNYIRIIVLVSPLRYSYGTGMLAVGFRTSCIIIGRQAFMPARHVAESVRFYDERAIWRSATVRYMSGMTTLLAQLKHDDGRAVKAFPDV